MKKFYSIFLMIIVSALNASQPSVTLRPSGGPLTQIQENQGGVAKGINDLVSLAAVPNLSLLWQNNLSSLNPSNIKYYRTFLTEVFSAKLSLLMGSAVCVADQSAPLALSLVQNLQLSRYIRSFSQGFNPTTSAPASGQYAGQALSPADTFAGVIVINNFSSQYKNIGFQAAFVDQGSDVNGNTLYSPNTITLLPDYQQNSAYDGAVFSQSTETNNGFVFPGDVKFIPALDFTDSWYDHDNELWQDTTPIRSVWYRTADLNQDNADYQALTLNGTAQTPVYGAWTGVLISQKNGVPFVQLFQNDYSGIIYKGTDTTNADVQNFFNNDPGVQWAPVLLISDNGLGNGTGTIDIIGLVKLNPYYFPLYYSGFIVPESTKFTYDANNNPNAITSYVNPATNLTYFSERKIFDSIVTIFNNASALGEMPQANYAVNPSLLYMPTLLTTKNVPITEDSSKNFLPTSWVAIAPKFLPSGVGVSLVLSQPLVNPKTPYLWDAGTVYANGQQLSAYGHLQNFALAKMVGLLQMDTIPGDSSNATYESLFKQSIAELKKYYILPGFLTNIKDGTGLSAIERLLNAPSSSQSIVWAGQTDTFMPANGSYVPAVKVSTIIQQ